jgi:hypothetical protein
MDGIASVMNLMEHCMSLKMSLKVGVWLIGIQKMMKIRPVVAKSLPVSAVDEWNEGTKNLAKDLKEQRDKVCNRADELKEFNKNWEKLSDEQRQKCLKEALKNSGL